MLVEKFHHQVCSMPGSFVLLPGIVCKICRNSYKGIYKARVVLILNPFVTEKKKFSYNAETLGQKQPGYLTAKSKSILLYVYWFGQNRCVGNPTLRLEHDNQV